jgi:hypothetical protein
MIGYVMRRDDASALIVKALVGRPIDSPEWLEACRIAELGRGQVRP